MGLVSVVEGEVMDLVVLSTYRLSITRPGSSAIMIGKEFNQASR